MLTNRYREAKLALCRQLLGMPTLGCGEPIEKLGYRDRFERFAGQSLRDCRVCGRGQHEARQHVAPGPIAPRQYASDTACSASRMRLRLAQYANRTRSRDRRRVYSGMSQDPFASLDDAIPISGGLYLAFDLEFRHGN